MGKAKRQPKMLPKINSPEDAINLIRGGGSLLVSSSYLARLRQIYPGEVVAIHDGKFPAGYWWVTKKAAM